MNSAARCSAPVPAAGRAPGSGSGLVLVSPGGLSGTASLDPCSRLAGLLGLRLLEAPLAPPIGPRDDPAAALAALAERPGGWLLPLPLDPGEDLDGPGCWAEALAAWRQPTVLLLRAEWPPAGAARAYGALLQAAGVPLLGLVQLGGLWRPDQRRSDGLPWLGWLPPGSAWDGAEADAAGAVLREASLRRWRALSAARPDPLPAGPRS